MQFAVEKVADSVYLMAADARFIYVNQAACHSLGYSREELLHMSVQDIDPDFSLDRWHNHWADLKEHGSLVIRSHHRARTGLIFPVEIRANYLAFDGREYNCAFAQDITDREWAEEHRRLLSAMVEQSHEGMAVIDFEGNILFVNQALASAHGWQAIDLIGQNVSVLHPPEEMPAVQAANREVVEKGNFSGEIWHRHREGSSFPTLMHNSLLHDEEDQPIGIILTARDITDRKRAEELDRRNAILSAELEINPDGVLVVDAKGKILSFNMRFVKMWGIPEEVVKSRSDEQALQSVLDKLVDPEAFVRRVQDVYRHQSEKSHDEIRLVDGRVFERYSSPMFSQEGEYYARVWYFRDVTERVRAQAALAKSEAFLRAILDGTTAVIYVKDLEGKYLLINRRHETLFHVTKADVVGKTDFDLFPREVAEAFRVNDKKVIESGEPAQFEEAVAHDNATHFYISVKFPLRDANGALYALCGISTDITAHKQSEDSSEKATENQPAESSQPN